MAQNKENVGNHLLDFLGGSKPSLLKRMKLVSLGLKDVLYETNRPITDIYFPINGVVSWVQEIGNGKTVEVATTGNDGFVGVPVLLGADRTPGTSFSQIPGEALRMSVDDFRAALAANPAFVRILMRYVQALVVQIAQGNACNGAHQVEQRCARWLLMCLDRVGRPSFTLTQEFLAQMLGVRRSGVNEVAMALQAAGLIQYSRGNITILNRAGLEAQSCVCYQIMREEFRRMLRDLQEGEQQ